MSKKAKKKKDNGKNLKLVENDKKKNVPEPLLNQDIDRILRGLDGCQKFKGRKFGYMLAKNARTIQKEMEDLEKSVEDGLDKKLSDDLVEFREKSANLNAEHKIAFGKPEPEEFKTEYEKLTKKYKACIEKYDEDYQEMLKEEANIKIFQCKIKDVPEEITGGLMADIFECVEYDK